jgi:hypothetical protein
VGAFVDATQSSVPAKRQRAAHLAGEASFVATNFLFAGGGAPCVRLRRAPGRASGCAPTAAWSSRCVCLSVTCSNLAVDLERVRSL